MTIKFGLIIAFVISVSFFLAAQQDYKIKSVTVPIILDHNRMLVEAEIQRMDDSWRQVLLWVDTGNPDFFLSKSLADDLGYSISTNEKSANGNVNSEALPFKNIRIGGKLLNFHGVRTVTASLPFWLFSTMHNDANLPSTVLKNYQIVFDYPKLELTIADPGSLPTTGVRSYTSIQPQTGIVQIDAEIDGEKFSFALDNGASYSFASDEVLEKLSVRQPGWQQIIGTTGCANMWGYWPPEEQTLPVMRIPEIIWGQVHLKNVGVVGVRKFSPNGPTLGAWYSQKTTRPVDGFLGPNAFKGYRVEIDYANSVVYFEKTEKSNFHDMDIVGLTLQPQEDGSYKVIGITKENGKPVAEDVEPGDRLLMIDDFKVTGATMGTVVDKLRGNPGGIHVLILERGKKEIKAITKVKRLL